MKTTVRKPRILRKSLLSRFTLLGTALAPGAWAAAWTSTATGGFWTSSGTWTAGSGSPAPGDTVTIATTPAISNDWCDYPDPGNPASLTVDPANPAVFFQLIIQ